ncbi:MAG: hypothetical protein HQL99_04600 [Magnetococcales bacterium]|nr:hypothetical protein [Magnetococcales bacterium]
MDQVTVMSGFGAPFKKRQKTAGEYTRLSPETQPVACEWIGKCKKFPRKRIFPGEEERLWLETATLKVPCGGG